MEDSRNSGTTIHLYAVAYSNNEFVTVGNYDSSTVILTSPDGVIWTRRVSGFNFRDLYGIATDSHSALNPSSVWKLAH